MDFGIVYPRQPALQLLQVLYSQRAHPSTHGTCGQREVALGDKRLDRDSKRVAASEHKAGVAADCVCMCRCDKFW